MLLMGDEVRRTQGGNNNAYCHDDESNWFDWTLVEKHAEVLRFVSLIAARRSLRDITPERERLSLIEMLRDARTAWHGVALCRPDWGLQSHSLAWGVEMRREGLELHLIANAFWESLDFDLPQGVDREPWRRWIDTSLESPEDIVDWRAASAVADCRTYHAGPRSVVVLWRRLGRYPIGRTVDSGRRFALACAMLGGCWRDQPCSRSRARARLPTLNRRPRPPKDALGPRYASRNAAGVHERRQGRPQ